MKNILIAIRPKWVEKIASGKKTIEVRKSVPKEVPFKAYIYATKPKKWFSCGAVSTSDELLWLANGKVEMCDGFKFWADSGVYQGLNGRVIGYFICDKVEEFSVGSLRSDDIENLACLSYSEMIDYFYKPEELDGKTAKLGYAWHISQLKIYDKPRELSEFGKVGFGHEVPLKRPPQSWMYIEDLGETK